MSEVLKVELDGDQPLIQGQTYNVRLTAQWTIDPNEEWTDEERKARGLADSLCLYYVVTGMGLDIGKRSEQPVTLVRGGDAVEMLYSICPKYTEGLILRISIFLGHTLDLLQEYEIPIQAVAPAPSESTP